MSFLRRFKKQPADARSEPEGSERQRYGLDLRTGDEHYRAWVGPPQEYDLITALQVTLLLAAGLQETHRLCDVGCGSLRAGRMLIPYLRPGHYFGIEPERWLVEEGIEKELGQGILEAKRPSFRFVADFSLQGFEAGFDFVIAQSVFSHTYPDLLRLGLRNIAGSLTPSGKLFMTWNEATRGAGKPGLGPNAQVLDNGWIRRGIHTYSWQEMEGFLRETGLVGRRLKWPHPRQTWCVVSRPEHEGAVEELSRAIRSPRQGWIKSRSA